MLSKPHLWLPLPGVIQWVWVKEDVNFSSWCLQHSGATCRLMKGMWQSFGHVYHCPETGKGTAVLALCNPITSLETRPYPYPTSQL